MPHSRKSDATLGRGGGACHAWHLSYDNESSHSCNAGTEHVGFSPSRQASRTGRGGRAGAGKGETLQS